MKVAILIESLGGGGEERLMVLTANELHKRNIHTQLVLVNQEGPFLDQLSPQVQIIDLAVKNPYYCFPGLFSYLRNEKPDILISTLSLVNLIALITLKLSRAKTKSVIRIANTVSQRKRAYLKKKIERYLFTRIYPWADEIIAVSNGVAEDLSEYASIPRHRIRVVYNPVITPDLLSQAEEDTHTHPWLESGQPPVIIGMGRLTEQKNFPLLINAFLKLLSKIEARLIILGEGEERDALEYLVRELNLEDKVALPGFVSNPFRYLKQASVFVLSSNWEGLPTVLIEALACGVQVVSTNCPSGPNEILAGGKYGYLTPMEDIESLSEAIHKVLNGQHKKVDHEWLEQFTLEHSMKMLLEIIN
jgi:glycosyltransferase involved in cell wall biosynthesis